MKIVTAQTLHQRRVSSRAVVTPDIFWLPGKALMYTGTGAGVESNTNNLASYALPDAVTSTARGAIPFPTAWAGKLARMYIAWMPADANTGNVYFSIANARRIADGATISVVEEITTTVDAAPASATKTVITSVNFAALPVDIAEGEFISIAIARSGAHASDTYANTIYLIGLGFGIRR